MIRIKEGISINPDHVSSLVAMKRFKEDSVSINMVDGLVIDVYGTLDEVEELLNPKPEVQVTPGPEGWYDGAMGDRYAGVVRYADIESEDKSFTIEHTEDGYPYGEAL